MGFLATTFGWEKRKLATIGCTSRKSADSAFLELKILLLGCPTIPTSRSVPSESRSTIARYSRVFTVLLIAI